MISTYSVNSQKLSAAHHSLCSILFFLLFALILLFPYKVPIVKVGVILFIIAIKIASVYDWGVPHKIINWFAVFIVANYFFMALGYVRGNQVNFYINTELVYPVLYLILVSLINKEDIQSIFKSLFIVSCVGLSVGVIALLEFNFMGIREFVGYQASERPGYPIIAISGGPIINNIYAYFLFSTYYLLNLKNIKRSVIYKLYLIVGLVYIIGTSRRSIFVVLLLSLSMIFFFSRSAKKSYKEKITKRFIPIFMSLGVIIVLFIIINNIFKIINFNELFDFFLSSFKFASKLSKADGIDSSNYFRYLQFFSLVDGWKKNPLIGAGVAANASVIRSDIPGAYELSYLAILFQRGIIGFLIYLFLYVSIFFMFGKILKKSDNDNLISFVISIEVAYSALLIMNISNPYLQAFDHMWIIYINMFTMKILMENKNDQKFLLFRN